MYGKYLYALHNKYGYTGNWRPDTAIKVGSYIPCEKKGFVEWFMNTTRMKSNVEAMNVNLRDYCKNDIIKGLRPRTFVANTEYIASGVSISADGSLGEIGLSASKKCGFFMSLNNVFEKRLDIDGIKRIMANSDIFAKSESIAIVTGITYACGVIAIFNEKGASAKLSSKGLLGAENPVISKATPIPAGKLTISAQSGDCIIFSSDNIKKPLIPFLKISILRYRKESNLILPQMKPLPDMVMGIEETKLHKNIRNKRLDKSRIEEIDFSYSDLVKHKGDWDLLLESSVPKFDQISKLDQIKLDKVMIRGGGFTKLP